MKIIVKRKLQTFAIYVILAIADIAKLLKGIVP
jgi:hypothetical protein